MRSIDGALSGNKRGKPKGKSQGTSHESTDPLDLDELLLNLSPDGPLTMRNALDHEVLFGGVGSGKTSGPSSQFLRDFLTADFGGLYPSCKPEDWIAFESFARDPGQSDSLILVSHDDATKPKQGQPEVVRQSLNRK